MLININMRCIEMILCFKRIAMKHLININMRCIEIEISDECKAAGGRLTLT